MTLYPVFHVPVRRNVSVNKRLMIELAEREKRIVTKQELLASKFPTTVMCPQCWLDGDMEMWDKKEVFYFLQHWYWPSDNDYAISVRNNSSTEGVPLPVGSVMRLVLLMVVIVCCFFGRSSLQKANKSAAHKSL